MSKKAIKDGSPPAEVQAVAAEFENRETVQRSIKLNLHGNHVAVFKYAEELKSD